MSKKLYFISLVPPPPLRERIKSLKEEMKNRFDAKHALKAPAHITLQMPFRRDESFEQSLLPALSEFASNQHSFEIELNGFDCFRPRVLFIKIMDHQPVQQLYISLRMMLVEKLQFEPEKLKPGIHPHLTIATRDLKEDLFYEAWSEFEKRPFEERFTADSLSLLKHNGKHWDIYKEFPFRRERRENYS